MTTCLVIRHGQSQANVDGVLAGHLDSGLSEAGAAQAAGLAEALREVPIRVVVTSPLSRCRATAEALAAAHPDVGPPQLETRVVEVRYGSWTGRRLADLAGEGLWRDIQAAPSTVTFPPHEDHEHESMADMAARAWAGWLDWDTRIADSHGADAVWALVSHGDVIKALAARALGLPLDSFQSIVVDPSSVSILHRAGDRTAVSGLNLRQDGLARLSRPDRAAEPLGVAAGVVGGGDG
jgi:probable phosphomutase (TIGR03848 family)